LREWVRRVESLQEGSAQIHDVTGLERWFVLPPSRDAQTPPRYKIVLITWLAIYPLLTAVLYFFGDQLLRLPLGFRTLVVTAIIVPAMLYVMMPLMTPLFARWLYPRESGETTDEDTDPQRRGYGRGALACHSPDLPRSPYLRTSENTYLLGRS
jgi:uncharacterized protein